MIFDFIFKVIAGAILLLGIAVVLAISAPVINFLITFIIAQPMIIIIATAVFWLVGNLFSKFTEGNKDEYHSN